MLHLYFINRWGIVIYKSLHKYIKIILQNMYLYYIFSIYFYMCIFDTIIYLVKYDGDDGGFFANLFKYVNIHILQKE